MMRHIRSTLKFTACAALVLALWGAALATLAPQPAPTYTTWCEYEAPLLGDDC
jgi:hypothetical protein